MRPENTRVTRRERRRAWRGIPTGRRATRRVQTTPGRKHERRAWDALMDAVFASRPAEGTISECAECGERITLLGHTWATDEGTTCCYTDPAPEWTPHKPATEGRRR